MRTRWLLIAGLVPLCFSQTSPTTPISADVDTSWRLLAGILVFFMQTGFGMVEAGNVRAKNVTNILFKNLLDSMFAGLFFWAFGWAFAFGGDTHPDHKRNEFIGSGEFFLVSSGDFPISRYSDWFFQWAFSATAATIVSGAVAERTQMYAYLIFSALLTGFVYPVGVHWCWSKAGWLSPFAEDNFNRLGHNGLIDFAGSGVVHLVGGTAAFVGAAMVGPRTGRFERRLDGKYHRFLPHNKVLTVLGVFILWFGWYGFNAGSTLALSNGASNLSAKIAVCTTLSAIASGIIVTVMSAVTHRGILDLDTAANAVLAGLVSITASCAVVEPWAAIVIGSIGGIVYYLSAKLLEVMHIDDVVQASAVHGFCGMWGVFAAGLFAMKDNIELAYGKTDVEKYGLFYGGGWEQIGVQCVGILVLVLWSGFWSVVIFAFLRFANRLRVSMATEEMGLDLREHGESAYDELQHAMEQLMAAKYQFPARGYDFSSIGGGGMGGVPPVEYIEEPPPPMMPPTAMMPSVAVMEPMMAPMPVVYGPQPQFVTTGPTYVPYIS